MSFSLDHVSLFEAPPFAALSYCWGQLSDQVLITVNGLEFSVTANLLSALNRLKREGVECVWVDAICINQKDPEERSHQVRRMGAIYQEANQVAVWLGDAQEMAEEDIDSLSAIAYSVQSNSAQRAFHQLLLKPYWTRVWIIQELAAASKITVFYGHYKLLWETLEKVSHVAFTADMERIEIEGLRAKFQNLLQFRNDRLDRKPVRLLEAIYRSRYALSTDPKDKIYGLLGLVYDGAAFIPEPNYLESVEDTYTGFSKALIEKGFPLDIIYLRTSHRQTSKSLPSWVVDWMDLDDALAKQEFEHIQASIERNPSSLSRNQTTHASFSRNTLIIRGTILGRIDGMGSAYSTDRNVTTAGFVPPRRGPSSVPLDIDGPTYVFKALFEMQSSSAATAEPSPNPIKLWRSNDETKLEDFFRDTMPPDELVVLLEWIDANWSFIIFGNTLEFWNGTWTSRPAETDCSTPQDTCLRSLVTTILSGMCIATLQTGELGWVHPQSQKGDMLGRVLGCDRDIVLRSVAGGFQVIGEARCSWFGGEPELADKVENLTIL